MMRSLSSAVAGLRSHQNRMDVIGNNIANVNTYAFKSSRVTFSDVYYQTMSGGSGARAGISGGTNPTQIGYGSKISTIDVLHTRAGGTTTDRTLDVVIEGEGFLVVYDPNGGESYTRLGSLYWDDAGNLVDYTGAFVQGYAGGGALSGDITLETTVAVPAANERVDKYLTGISIGPDGKITGTVTTAFDDANGGPYAVGSTYEIGQLAIAMFGNVDGLVQSGSSHFITGANSGNPIYVEPGEGGSGATVAGMLEMSNVDLSKEFSDMIVTQRGFQANSRIITVSDEMLQELVNLKR